MAAVPVRVGAEDFDASPKTGWRVLWMLANHTALPYIVSVQSVIETRAYLAAADDAGMTDEEMESAKDIVARDPTAGDLIVGSGGVRKLRVAGKGKGKSGGYRVITFFGGVEIPVFLLTVFGKGERANLTRAEINDLAKLTKTLRDSLGPRRVQ